ncbi:DNA helicase [Rhodopirellula europaea 6C]|uniref:DNA helicase n=1 Tax=Rhodopirellula europaea 6C TaxID=1263867 RepID=M2AK53_9BACT|nr:DNA helicase [Rhodopirellula europaea 6C]
MAIECDGATYHSSHTARDRDRIRQTILESLGWTIIRVWSTDWVRNPDRQIERILEAYEKSLLSPINAKQDSQDDVEEDLEPTFIQKEDDQQRRAKLSFDSIDEVPDDAIHLAATYVLTQAGAMTVDDLVRQTSRELGFRRTGQKIRSRIECRLNADLENGSLIRTGHKIAVSS